MSIAGAEEMARAAAEAGARGQFELQRIFERDAERMAKGELGHRDQPWMARRRLELPTRGQTDPDQRPEGQGLPAPEEKPVGSLPSCNAAEQAIYRAVRSRRPGNGITSQELAAEAHTDPRTARAIVAHLRCEHHMPIGGTPAESYFWPNRPEDLDRTLKSLESRRIEIEAAITGIRAGAQREFGTGILPGVK